MRTSEHRKTSYGNKVGTEGTQERYTAIVAAQQENMHGGYQAFCENYVPKMQAVLVVLDEAGVARIARGAYYAYASTLWHISQVMSGAQALVEAGYYKTLWTSRGLTALTLQAIMDVIFPPA
jgi:hypothetical protein